MENRVDSNNPGTSRRRFIQLTGLVGTVFAIGYYMPAFGAEPTMINAAEAEGLGIDLNAWISIDTNGKVTITNHRAEMGQGSFQSVPQIIAEELEVDLNQVDIVFGKGDHKKYGDQTTGGSSTIRGSYKMLLQLSATAREMLIEAAAKTWKVSASECYAENGQVIHKPTNRSLGYGKLVEVASKLTPPKKVTLKAAKDYKIIRKPLPRQDIPSKTNGEAIFGLDIKKPGMLYAVLERSPRFKGKVKSFDESAAKAVPGVKYVFKMYAYVFGSKREGVAVVADNLWAAIQGRKALNIVWDDSGFEHLNTEQLYLRMNEALKKDSLILKSKGDFANTYAKSVKKIEAVYETPYESHSCMEPLNCLAHVHDGICEIWGPTQQPGLVQQHISEKLGFAKEKVIVNMTFLGGGFGRKAFNDFPFEAAYISKEINAPVKVVWTREDDTTIGPFRPGMVYQCNASLDENGGISSFRTKMAGQNMDAQDADSNLSKPNYSTTEGFPPPYYNVIPNFQFGDNPIQTPIPVMWWRSVYSSTNAFAYESFMDELAGLAGKDPLEFRRKLLAEERYQVVMNKLEAVSGWKSKSANAGYGIALTECFKTIVGHVVKVSKNEEGKLKIDQAWVVMDCGWYVNPDIIHAQIEGSIVMALGAATKHATLFEDGKAVLKNFDGYKLPRISEIPKIEVHIIDNQEDAGGVGEPALPGFAPALTNAIFNLTGKRIRKLPLNLEEV